MLSNGRKAIIYLRKSHLSDADNDLEAHERRCRQIAANRGETDPIIIREAEGHRSAFSDTQRPGYRELEGLIASNRVSLIFINDRSRIWRNAVEWLTFLTLCRKHNTEIIPAIEAAIGDVSDPNQQLLEFINGWKNEQYRTAVSKSLRATKADLRKAGLFVSNRPTMGLSLVGSKFDRKIVANDDLPVIIEILELYVENNGGDMVARIMNARGRKWRYGQNLLPVGPQSVINLVNGIEQFQPFLDPLLYERVLETRARRRNRKMNSARNKHPKLLLSKLLYCSVCGNRFYSNHHTNRKGENVAYPSYLHPGHVACSVTRRWFGAKRIDDQVWEQLATFQEKILAGVDSLTQRIADAKPDDTALQDYLKQKDKLERELLALRRNYNRGDFGDTNQLSVMEFFREEQTRLSDELNQLKPPPVAVPRKNLTLAQIKLFSQMPLAELRQNAEQDSNAGNAWLFSIIERAELCGNKLSLKLHPDLATLLNDTNL